MNHSSQTANYYDSLAHRYDQRRKTAYHQWLYAHQERIAAKYLTGKILDAGCGTGRMMTWCSHTNRSCIGIDRSWNMLRSIHPRNGKRIQSDLHSLPFASGSFDAVMAWKVLPHVDDPARVFSEFSRIVKPGGIIIAEFYNRSSLRTIAAVISKGITRRTGRPGSQPPFTRTDTLKTIQTFLPPDLACIATEPVRIMLPAGFLLEIPFIGPMLARADDYLAQTKLKSFAGFLTVIFQKNISLLER